MRTVISIVVIVLLLGTAAAIQRQFELVPREDPLGNKLLYLPTAKFLEFFSLGNKQIVADYLYLWSIQYYSQFKPDTQFLYLDYIYELITDLDPHYRDPYRIGAVIMLIEAEGHMENRKKAVLSILDKGIAANPDDYTLPEEAAWQCYINFKDHDLAAHYALIASKRPNAPHRVKRLYGYLSQNLGLDEAIKYWEGVLAEADTDYERLVSRNNLYDLKVRRDREILEPYLKEYRKRFGHCSTNWQEVIKQKIAVNGKILTSVPLDPASNAYEIDPNNCTLVAIKHLTDN